MRLTKRFMVKSSRQSPLSEGISRRRKDLFRQGRIVDGPGERQRPNHSGERRNGALAPACRRAVSEEAGEAVQLRTHMLSQSAANTIAPARHIGAQSCDGTA